MNININSVKAYRLTENMTQNVLATKVNTTARNLRKIESGRQNPSLYTAMYLAKALNRTVEELFELPSTNNSSQDEPATHIEN